MKIKTHSLVKRLLRLPSAENELADIAASHSLPIAGILTRDDPALARGELAAGNYIVNMDDSMGSGTHWCALIVRSNDPVDYSWFDSFGMPPPQALESLSRQGNIDFNDVQIQAPDEVMCGLYALAFLFLMKNRMTFSDIVCHVFADVNDRGSTAFNKRVLMNLFG